MSNDPKRKYKGSLVRIGGVQSTVYATEVSPEEYLCYTTEESEKVEVEQLAKQLDGNIELAIEGLRKRNGIKAMKYRKCLWSMKPCFRSTGYAGVEKQPQVAARYRIP